MTFRHALVIASVACSLAALPALAQMPSGNLNPIVTNTSAGSHLPLAAERSVHADGSVGGVPVADSAQVLSVTGGVLDVDGNGQFDPLTDGLLLLRYAFGLRGNALIANAIGTGATRTAAEDIEAYIQLLLVPGPATTLDVSGFPSTQTAGQEEALR